MSGSPDAAKTLVDLDRTGGGFQVTWADGGQSVFHAIWLRDNCRCPDCGEPATGRRKLRLTAIPGDLSSAKAILDERGDLGVTWPDGHESRYPAAWLRLHAYDQAARQARAFAPRLWNDEFRASPPTMKFADVDRGGAAFLEMLHHLRDSGLCFLRGAPAEAGTLEPFARKIGPVQESNFGLVQDLVVDETKRSVANRAIALKPHTDEPYRASPPGLLMFQCIETDLTGAGSSIFLDGFEIAERVRAEDPEGFAALARHRQTFRRHFADDVDLIAEFPVIALDEFGNLTGLRINDRVAAPLSIPPEAVEVYYRGLRRLLELAEDDDLTIRRVLHPGDVVVFDNHRVLHGRTELTMKGRRFLQWMQVERGDFHSALRIAADRIQQPRGIDPLLRGAY